ncbi:hypothetical protein [Streptomyces sp. NPDC004284]|uniref:hypothetical protein n=1 Tax=Streptomyces sp. NPDC004284 TaxID=3364695 RepID=UPI0036D0DA30
MTSVLPRPVDPFLPRLPRDAATTLLACDRKVRSGTTRQCLDVYERSYAFDFAADDCAILDSGCATELSDDDIWPLGADGGGNLYVMRTHGRVAVWFHEGQVLVPHQPTFALL